MRHCRSLALLLPLLLSILPNLHAAPPEADFTPLFNGKSFAGWLHSDSHWRIEKGAIVGEIPAGENLRRNLFLFWKGELHDFELRLRFRVGGHPSANSGVQFRSQMLPNAGAAGYQADLDDGAVWLGRIYDEHGRGLLVERGSEVTIDANGARTARKFADAKSYLKVVRKGAWNDYAVRAVGPRIEVSLNGKRTAVLIDNQPGQHDYSGRLALQLHSGPGPAKIEFKDIALRHLGKTEPPPPPAAPNARRAREGLVPKKRDGTPVNVGFEAGTLADWKVTGEAWKRQPVRGDTVTPRRPGQASDHVGEFWVGGYEFLLDAPTGTLESIPFQVTHPFASFLVGGGPHRETRVDIIEATTRKVIFSASGPQNENLEPVVVRLEKYLGKDIAIRVVDEHSGAWGHVNYDDFRFHEKLPEALVRLSLPRTLRKNPLLAHLQKNPAAAEPKSPALATVANMYLPEGFHAELIAAEPDVRQPIAFTIDARGRLWVAEAYSYPQRRPEGEAKDRITIFGDRDGDGTFETRKVFTEGLNLVSGLEVGYGGVWVGAAPELLFIPDADGDDIPDGAPRVLLDGWGYQDTHETLNSFTWGPDGWLYGNQGVFNHSRIGKPGTPDEKRVEMRAGVWRYHPLRHRFEIFAHGGSNQWGLDFNEVGALFMTQCRSYWGRGPTTHVILRGHYWNQANARHAPFVSGEHPRGAPHFRNFLRASARYGHGEGGAGAPGSRARYGGHSHVGTMIYLGDNWPDEYRDHLFTHNLHGHRINHQVNERRGSGYETKHAGREVLYVEDSRYVAVDLDYGPDGAVYIIDWYDRQHCHSPNMERWDRSDGRIYRMSYAATYKPRSVDLRALSDAELARLQTHKNAWYARTARRLLAERAALGTVDPFAVSLLEELTRATDRTRLVLRGMWALHVMGKLTRPAFARMLIHGDEYVRAWAIRLATEEQPADDRHFARFLKLARFDGASQVRLALASYLADAPPMQAWELAGALARHEEDAKDAYLPRMIWFGIAPHVPGDLERAFSLARETRIPVLREFIEWYAAKTAPGLERLVATLPELRGAERRRTLRAILFAVEGVGGREMPQSWSRIGEALYEDSDRVVRGMAEKLGALFVDEILLARLRAMLADTNRSAKRRRQAFETLRKVADPNSTSIFLGLLDDPTYRSDVIAPLARFDHPETAAALIARLERFSATDRERAVRTLATRATFARPLLEAVAAGRIAKTILSSLHVRQLRNLGDEKVDALLARVWGKARRTSADAKGQIAKYAKLFREAPVWAYDASAGGGIFEKTCGTCHPVAGKGATFGPDLAGAGRNGLDYFLESIVDPNAVVGADYQVTLIVMKDGTTVTGLIQADSADAITVRTIDETRVIKKKSIAIQKEQTDSLMPEGLLDGLSGRQRIELLKYLMSLR